MADPQSVGREVAVFGSPSVLPSAGPWTVFDEPPSAVPVGRLQAADRVVAICAGEDTDVLAKVVELSGAVLVATEDAPSSVRAAADAVVDASGDIDRQLREVLGTSAERDGTVGIEATATLRIDPDGEVLAADDGATALFRTPPDDLLGTVLLDQFPDSRGFALYERLSGLDNPAGSFVEYSPTFDQWLRTTVDPVAEGYDVTVEDVTDDHRADDERTRSERATEKFRAVRANDALSAEDAAKRHLQISCERLLADCGFVVRTDDTGSTVLETFGSEPFPDAATVAGQVESGGVVVTETADGRSVVGATESSGAGTYAVCWVGPETAVSESARVFVQMVTEELVRVFDRDYRLASLERERSFDESVRNALPDMLFSVGLDGRFERFNDRLRDVTGYDDATLRSIHPLALIADPDRPAVDAATDRALAGERTTVEANIETVAGDWIEYELSFAPVESDGQVVGLTGVARDVSDRKAYERALTGLHDSTADLLAARSAEAVADVVVTAAADVLGLDVATVYEFDQSSATLSRAAVSVSGHAPPASLSAGDGPAWAAFVDGEERTVTEGALYGDAVATELYVPLGEYGLLVVGCAESSLRERTLTAVELLATDATAALRRIDRDEQLRDREADLSERNARLDRLQAVNDQIREISRKLVAAETPAAAHSAVCERLVAVDRYAAVWTGSADPGTSELTVRATAGDVSGYLDAVDRSVLDDWSDLPAAQALREDAPVVVDAIAEAFRSTPWRQQALSRGYQSVAAVPVGYDSVLSVYATEREAFDEETVSVLSDLASLLSHTLGSIARRDALRSPGDRQLAFELTPDPEATPLWAAVADIDGTRINNVYTAGDGVSVRGSVPTGEADRLRSRTAAVDGVAGLALLETDGHLTGFRLSLSASPLGALIAETGGRLGTLTVENGQVRTTLVVPMSVRPQSVLTRLEAIGDGISLLAKRDHAGEIGDDRALLDRVTDRQREVLLAAYEEGFFEWPREHTAEEVAETLGISRPTFAEHLRRAERSLLEELGGDLHS